MKHERFWSEILPFYKHHDMVKPALNSYGLHRNPRTMVAMVQCNSPGSTKTQTHEQTIIGQLYQYTQYIGNANI